MIRKRKVLLNYIKMYKEKHMRVICRRDLQNLMSLHLQAILYFGLLKIKPIKKNRLLPSTLRTILTSHQDQFKMTAPKIQMEKITMLKTKQISNKTSGKIPLTPTKQIYLKFKNRSMKI